MKDIMSIRLITDNLYSHQVLVSFANDTTEKHEFPNLKAATDFRDGLQDIMCGQAEDKKVEQQDEVVRKNLLTTLQDIDEGLGGDAEDIYIKKLRKSLIKVVAHYSVYGDATNHPEVNKYLDKTLKF